MQKRSSDPEQESIIVIPRNLADWKLPSIRFIFFNLTAQKSAIMVALGPASTTVNLLRGNTCYPGCALLASLIERHLITMYDNGVFQRCSHNNRGLFHLRPE